MSEADSEGKLPLNVMFEAKSVARLMIRGKLIMGNPCEKIFVHEADKNILR